MSAPVHHLLGDVFPSVVATEVHKLLASFSFSLPSEVQETLKDLRFPLQVIDYSVLRVVIDKSDKVFLTVV